MKRISVLMCAMLLSVCAAMAIPAHKGSMKMQQPDGSYVTIRLHGDEWLHFNTTTDGYSVVKDERGYYVYAELSDGQLVATQVVAHDAALRDAGETAFLADVKKYLTPEMEVCTANLKQQMKARQEQTLAARKAAQYDYNNFRGLVILVQYNDKEFSRAD